ncbi:MAG: phosphatase PAP2 family protein [Bdellovibrio sp.]|nr:phosphatase PAP2 family protein [Bdellovibrio sp.]
MKLFLFLLLTLLSATPVYAQSEASSADATTANFESEVIQVKEVITEIPHTSWMGIKKSFSKESLPAWAAVVSSTLILLNNDEVILKDVQRYGRDSGIGNNDNTKAFWTLGEIDIIRLPTDFGSFTYFLGDGLIHGGIAAGFLINGYANKNSRAANTGLQLAHGMIISTFFNQFLKRTFGRESPYVKSEPFGKWSPYPSIPEYQSRTSKYDAMPSGHIMTTTLVFTVINENYPEYSHVTIPLGLTWGTLLMLGMVNNGVHWASDYPLGIAMGYVFGKASAQLGKKPKTEAEKKSTKEWLVMPTVDSRGSGLAFTYAY